ncbi:MAG TPA: hypothetical protein P5330_12000 [Candidatus Competibacteraceae bacterium]|nr:hypothetical protein [Candidatus Competibacteraceae bacterium]
MNAYPAPERLRRFGIEDARSNKLPSQILTPSPKTIAILLDEVILQFAADRAQQRAEGGAA